MSERKTGTITLTVPFHEDPIRRANGTLWDGRDRTGAAKDGRSIAVLHADIGKALLASWQGEAATDYAKRLAEIDARASAATRGPWPSEEGWHNGGAPSRTWKIPARQDGAEVEMLAEDALFVEHAREDVPWLLVQHRAASEALAALGIPDDGRSLAERVADLGKTLRGALHDAGLLRDMQGRKCHDDHAVATARREADILKRAARAAAIAGGEVVPEDAGPEAVASALRRATERTKVTASDLGDALREAEAELAARADPNGTWAKLEALAGKVAGIVDEVDMSAGADSTSGPLTASLPLLNIEAHGATAQELAEDLVDQLRFVWRTYGCADVDTLTPDARRLRDAVRALFASGDVAPSVDRRGNAP